MRPDSTMSSYFSNECGFSARRMILAVQLPLYEIILLLRPRKFARFPQGAGPPLHHPASLFSLAVSTGQAVRCSASQKCDAMEYPLACRLGCERPTAWRAANGRPVQKSCRVFPLARLVTTRPIFLQAPLLRACAERHMLLRSPQPALHLLAAFYD